MGCSTTKPKKQITHQPQMNQEPQLKQEPQFKQEDLYQVFQEQKKQKKKFVKCIPNLTSIYESTIVSRRCLQDKNFQPNKSISNQSV